MSILITGTIQWRRDTAANWTSANPVLAQGEPGYETNTLKLKIGDGTTAWNSLAYFAAGGGTGTVTSVGLAFNSEWSDIFDIASGSPVTVSGTITIGGIDPGADRLMFWDDSAGKYTFLTLGTNLSITGTTLNAVGGTDALTGGLAGNANYLGFTGGATTVPPILSVAGSDTNISMKLQSKGTGTLLFATGSSTNYQAEVAHVASAVNRLTLAGSATGNKLTLGAAGSDTNIGINYAAKGEGNHTFTGSGGASKFEIRGVATPANYLVAQSGPAGSGVAIQVDGSDTNVLLQIETKGTGLLRLGAGSGYALTLNGVASSVNNLEITPSTTGNHPVLAARGVDTNVNLRLSGKGTGTVQYWDPTSSTYKDVGSGGGGASTFVQGPAFEAKPSSSQSIATATDTKVIFNSETFDTTAAYDPVTNYRFQPGVAGAYQVNVNIVYTTQSAGALIQSSIRKNGAFYSRTNSRAPTTADVLVNISDIVYLNGTTDYVEAYTFHGGTGSQTIGTDCTFSAALIGVDTQAAAKNQASAFQAKITTSQSIPDGAYTKIIFGTEAFDTKGTYDVATGRFQPGVAGTYQLNATAYWNSGLVANQQTVLRFYVNGVNSDVFDSKYANTTGAQSNTVSGTFNLSATDYVEVFAYQLSGAAKTLGGFTTFSGGQIATVADQAIVAGDVLQTRVFAVDAGSSTSSLTLVNLMTSFKPFTPKSINSTIIIECSFQGRESSVAAINTMGTFQLMESSVGFGPTRQIDFVNGAGANSVNIPCSIMASVNNTALTLRNFHLGGFSSSASASAYATQAVFKITEIQN